MKKQKPEHAEIPVHTPDPPDDWGSPFNGSTPAMAINEAALLLELGAEMENRDVLAMPEFVNRLQWVVEAASKGVVRDIKEGSMLEAAWAILQARASNYVATKTNDDWHYILDNDDVLYDPPTVSESIQLLPHITGKAEGHFFLDTVPVSTLLKWCRLVASRNSNGLGVEEFLSETYAEGSHRGTGRLCRKTVRQGDARALPSPPQGMSQAAEEDNLG